MLTCTTLRCQTVVLRFENCSLSASSLPWEPRRRRLTCPRSFHVAQAAFPPAVLVLLEGADRAVRERYSVHAASGGSRQSRSCRTMRGTKSFRIPASSSISTGTMQAAPGSSLKIRAAHRALFPNGTQRTIGGTCKRVEEVLRVMSEHARQLPLK